VGFSHNSFHRISDNWRLIIWPRNQTHIPLNFATEILVYSTFDVMEAILDFIVGPEEKRRPDL
jgi:hypothetical protein